MKHLFLLLLAFSAFCSSAQNISGLYSGTLTNDSTKKIQHYELALSEYRGKITGYSYTTFVVNDTFYYSIKRVKANKSANELLVEDVKMLAHNFPEAPAKGVRQIITIPLNGQDSLTSINGVWKTTETKVYYSLHGAVAMQRDNDSAHSALVHHLFEINELQRPQQAAVAAVKKPVKEKESAPSATAVTTHNTIVPYTQRTNVNQQEFSVQADSLVLSFYDNGVVDGDTISVYLNDQNVLLKEKLTAAAVKKVIYLTPGPSDYKLTLVAENLGSIPPNTGLLMVQDGANRYEVRFSADLNTNAVLLFRRKNAAAPVQ